MNQPGIVHIVDDDPGILRSLGMLMEVNGLEVQTHESAEYFLEELDPKRPGCLVVDLRMPGVGGIELLQHLRNIKCEIPVVIISGHADVPVAVRSIKLGAIDLLQKPFEPPVLIDIVKRAIQSSIATQAQRGKTDAVRERFASLTERELELLKLVIAGRSNKQIAMDLHISPRTVAVHRQNIMAKTRAANAADLATLCNLAGIVPDK